ncbi:MAG: hypothetical protein IID39_02320 [Planctomycetes bacterium]|nr:hypothetical protein [Planctomycetota bacterium]
MKVWKIFVGIFVLVGVISVGLRTTDTDQNDRILEVELTLLMRTPFGQNAMKPFTLAWERPGERNHLTLPGLKNSHTLAFAWKDPYARKGPDDPVTCGTAQFLSVTVSKPGYSTWEKHFSLPGDFFHTLDGGFRRIERVILHPRPEMVAGGLLEQLSQTLPCGLDIYNRRIYLDLDEDGGPEAILSRHVESTIRESRHALEIRICSFREGDWESLFVANHQGTFVSGDPVEGSKSAPHGYSWEGPLRRGEGCAASLEITPVDAKGLKIPGESRTYVWTKGERTFVIR